MEGPVWISWCCTCPFPFVPSEPAGLQRFLPLFPCSPLPQHYSSFSLMSLFSGQQILTLSCSLRAHAFKRSCSLLCSCRRTWTRNVRSLNAQVRRAFHYEELTVCFTSVLFRFDSTSLLVQITLQLCWAVVKASVWTACIWIITSILHSSAHMLQRYHCPTSMLLLIFHSPFPLNKVLFYKRNSLRQNELNIFKFFMLFTVSTPKPGGGLVVFIDQAISVQMLVRTPDLMSLVKTWYFFLKLWIFLY